MRKNAPCNLLSGTIVLLTIDNRSMDAHSSTDRPQYDPGRLLDTLIEQLNLKNDAALSRLLQVAPPTISKIRNGKTDVGAPLLVRMHELSNRNIKELRFLMGDRRAKLRTRGRKYKYQVSMAAP